MEKRIYLDNETTKTKFLDPKNSEFLRNKKIFSSLKKSKIYLDNGATTRVDDEVLKAMQPFFNKFYGNPSSLHSFGAEAEEAVKTARKTISKVLNADDEKEIIFTGSATEADNLALKGVAFANSEKGDHILTTKIEHSAVLNPCKYLEKKGFKVTYLDVNQEGFVDIEKLKNSITNKTILVSIIHANHEVGTIQDLEEIGRICKENDVLFHTDAAQGFTKAPLDVKKFNLGLVTLNAHKLHGPKGVGALYVRSGVKIESRILGGPQEYGVRGGTENIPAIVGFSKAVEIGMKDMKRNTEKMSGLRDYMINELLKIPNSNLNGPTGNNRLCNNVNISFDFVEGEAMLMHLDIAGIAVSTGSACSSKSLKPSHVLTAMGRRAEEAHGSIRFSLSKYTTKEEIDYTIDKVKKVVETLRKLSPLTPKVA